MKHKTGKSAKKRIVSITKSGKLMRRNISAQHLTSGKSKRVLRGSNKKQELAQADRNKIKKLI